MLPSVYYVPSRNRPQNIQRLMDAWRDLKIQSDLVIRCDRDDPKLSEYEYIFATFDGDAHTFLWIDAPMRMVPKVNQDCVALADHYEIVSFLNDDHHPLTNGFDQIFSDKLEEYGGGIVYADDMFQGEALPTAAAMSSNLIKALGYYYPKGLLHCFADNAHLDIGSGLNRLFYLPEVKIEHCHPAAAKAPHDEGYVWSNDSMAIDQPAYEAWKQFELESDLERVKKDLGW